MGFGSLLQRGLHKIGVKNKHLDRAVRWSANPINQMTRTHNPVLREVGKIYNPLSSRGYGTKLLKPLFKSLQRRMSRSATRGSGSVSSASGYGRTYGSATWQQAQNRESMDYSYRPLSQIM